MMTVVTTFFHLLENASREIKHLGARRQVRWMAHMMLYVAHINHIG